MIGGIGGCQADNHMKRLNIGCGTFLLPGYINSDKHAENVDLQCDAMNLPFQDNSLDEILALHLIEHFDHQEAYGLLVEWRRALKIGGKLRIETPDLLEICKKFVDGDENTRVGLYGQLFARPWEPGQTHKFLYTENQLKGTLTACGFRDIVVTKTYRYLDCVDINLGIEAYK